MRAVLLALSIGLASGSYVSAQDSGVNACLPGQQGAEKTGFVAGSEYEPISWWTQLRISNAYFTNPDALRRIQVAYLYSPRQIGDKKETEKIFDKGSAGGVLFAVPKDKALGINGGVQLVSLGELGARFNATIGDGESLKKCLLDNGVFIASPRKDIPTSDVAAVFMKASGSVDK